MSVTRGLEQVHVNTSYGKADCVCQCVCSSCNCSTVAQSCPCCAQGEEEIMFIDYRKQLKVLFDNIAQLVRLLVLEFGLGLIVLALEWSVVGAYCEAYMYIIMIILYSTF